MAAGVTVTCGIARGVDTAYPPENRKFMGQTSREGAMVTEYPLDTKREQDVFLLATASSACTHSTPSLLLRWRATNKRKHTDLLRMENVISAGSLSGVQIGFVSKRLAKLRAGKYLVPDK